MSHDTTFACIDHISPFLPTNAAGGGKKIGAKKGGPPGTANMAMGGIGGGNMKGGGGGMDIMTEAGGGRLRRLWTPSLSLEVGEAAELPESPDERPDVLGRLETPCKHVRFQFEYRDKRPTVRICLTSMPENLERRFVQPCRRRKYFCACDATCVGFLPVKKCKRWTT